MIRNGYNVTTEWKMVQVPETREYIFFNPANPSENFKGGLDSQLDEYLTQNRRSAMVQPEDVPQLLQPTARAGMYTITNAVNDPNSVVINGQRVASSPNANLSDYAGQDVQQRPTFDSSGTTATSGGAGTPAAITGLPPELQDLYGQLKTYLDELKKRGQVLNPNIEISPEKVAEFLKQAETEINPFYSTQLKLARDVLYTGLGYAKEEIAHQEKNLEQRYGKNLRNLGETAAEQGFAQSGLRLRDESDLARDTQDTIDQGRRDLQFRATQAAQGFAQQFGTGELPSLNLGEAPKVAAGQYGFSTANRQLPLYQLSPEVYNNLVGSQEFARRGAVSARASELEAAERTKQSIAQQRQLIL